MEEVAPPVPARTYSTRRQSTSNTSAPSSPTAARPSITLSNTSAPRSPTAARRVARDNNDAVFPGTCAFRSACGAHGRQQTTCSLRRLCLMMVKGEGGGGRANLQTVSQLSKTVVSMLVMPLSVDDVFEALEYAARNNLEVSSRGTKHSMGGQSLVEGGKFPLLNFLVLCSL
jgi:hypothetical protein